MSCSTQKLKPSLKTLIELFGAKLVKKIQKKKKRFFWTFL